MIWRMQEGDGAGPTASQLQGRDPMCEIQNWLQQPCRHLLAVASQNAHMLPSKEWRSPLSIASSIAFFFSRRLELFGALMSVFPRSAQESLPLLGGFFPRSKHPKVALLTKVLSNYDLMRTVSSLAGMLTVPEFQANAVRLELLVHIAVSCCNGKGRIESRHLDTWLNRQLGVPEIASMEDPPEDAFVLNVLTNYGNFCVLTGMWEATDSAATYLMTAVGRMFKKDDCRWVEEAIALLKLSDLVVSRSGLSRWAQETSKDKRPVPIHPKAPLDAWASRVTFTRDDLEQLGIAESLLTPFTFDLSARQELMTESSQESELHRRPLIRLEDSWLVAIPSAVTYAVCRHLTSSAAEVRRLGELKAALMNHAQVRVLNLPTHGSRHSANLVALPIELKGVEFLCSSVIMQVGKRRFFHFLLIADDLHQFHDHGTLRPSELTGPSERLVQEHIEKVRDHLEMTYEVDSGHTFYIAGLLGQTIVVANADTPKKWTMTVARLNELELLFMDTDAPLDRLILLLNQRKEEEAKGLEIPFDNGILNLYAYWQQQGFNLRPPELRHDFPALLQIATDHILSYRLHLRRSVDEHCERIGNHHTVVVRANYASIYRAIRGQPVYVSMPLLKQNVLAFCMHAGGSTLWLLVKDPADARVSKAAFELWEALQFLLFRAVQSDTPTFDSHSPRIYVDFSAVQGERDGEGASTGGVEDSELHYEYDLHHSIAIIKLGRGFMSHFAGLENNGERYLLAGVLRAMWSLSKTPERAEGDLEGCALEHLGGVGGRVLHSLRVWSAAEQLAGSHSRGVYQHPKECIESRRHAVLTWQPSPERPQAVATERSTQILNTAVAQHATELQRVLRSFNRTSLIIELIASYETMLREKKRWRATSRAICSLYGTEEAMRAASEVDQHRTLVQISVRALVEASTCESQDSEGLEPDGHQIDELVARMATIISIGRDSDMLHFGMATQGITMHPNGSYNLDARVLEEISGPFLREAFSGSFQAAADDYESWFHTERPQSEKTTSTFDELGFQNAWVEEYGLAFSKFLEIAGELGDIAVKRGSPVVTATVDEVAAARADVGVSVSDVRTFLAAFGLPRRPAWLAGPGEAAKSVSPWRFERRLSLSLRPLVILDEHRGLFAYGLDMTREALAYVMDSIRSASFDKDVFSSKKMRAWLGGRVDELGRKFTMQVAENLRSTGWHAKTEVKLTQLGAPKQPDLGDVDVLAWRDDGRVLVIECKRLKPSRTVAEIALACDRFRGNVGDKLYKHMRRFNWLKENDAQLKKFVGMPSLSLRLQGLLVVNRPVPFKYLQNLPIPATEIVLDDALEKYLSEEQ